LAGELTVLMVGTIEPRKGYDCALAAFDRIWTRYPLAQSPNLLIIGRPGWKTERLQDYLNGHPFRNKRLFWLNEASDEILDHFYRSSNLLLSTSYAEGFGLPLWEASSYGLGVLARNLEVTRELGLANCTLFEDDSAIPLSNKIMETIDVKGLYKPNLTPLPSWSDSASALLSILGIEALMTDQDTSKVNCR
jgi:glycosyltransferase involved in cell wall biosynthesis